MSTSYHPETDGQTEVINRVLEQYLRSFVHHKPSLWSKFLSLAEWSYNTSIRSSTGFSPYHITYEKAPSSIPQYLSGTSLVEVVDSWLETRQLISKLRRNLLKAQEKMKFYVDKKRSSVTYNPDQFVYVRLRPYRQTSVTNHIYSKFSKRFYGPYRILDKLVPLLIVWISLQLPKYTLFFIAHYSSFTKVLFHYPLHSHPLL
jgi:hypothetical protein